MAYQLRFKIRKMKLTTIFSYADMSREEKDMFALSEEATSYFWDYCTKNDDSCVENECALFRQLMLMDKAVGWEDTNEVITALDKKLIYVDFSDAFKRNKYYTALLLKYGFTFDFGNGEVITYQMFERSNSMARRNTISFINSRLREVAQQRLRLEVAPEKINYAKFAAYNGLMMSQGYRVMKQLDANRKDMYPFNDETVVVVGDIFKDDINLYDGEGLIAPSYAEHIRNSLPQFEQHKPTSFQIRLPYIKGMLHECDFNRFFSEKGLKKLTDMFGVEHDASKIRIILTASQFKGAAWIRQAAEKADKGAMEYYWEKLREYDHALYISGFNRPVKRRIKLNYQVLHTPDLPSEEFAEVRRMSDDLYNSLMGFGEGTGAEKAVRQQKALIKTNGISNVKSGFIADEDATEEDTSQLTIDQRVIAAVKKCGCLIGTKRAKELCKSTAMGILRNMAVGRFVVEGENRYLSADLLSFMYDVLLRNCDPRNIARHLRSKEHEKLEAGRIYVPSKNLTRDERYALLRNPHISRFELAKCIPYYIEKNDKKNEMRCYFGHLDGVVMINSESKLHERLSGADFDGDIVKLVTNTAYNKAVKNGNDLVQIEHLSSQEVRADDIDSIINSIAIAFDNKIGQYCKQQSDERADNHCTGVAGRSAQRYERGVYSCFQYRTAECFAVELQGKV